MGEEPPETAAPRRPTDAYAALNETFDLLLMAERIAVINGYGHGEQPPGGHLTHEETEFAKAIADGRFREARRTIKRFAAALYHDPPGGEDTETASGPVSSLAQDGPVEAGRDPSPIRFPGPSVPAAAVEGARARDPAVEASPQAVDADSPAPAAETDRDATIERAVADAIMPITTDAELQDTVKGQSGARSSKWKTASARLRRIARRERFHPSSRRTAP